MPENTHSDIPSNVPFSIFSDWSFEKFHCLRTFGAGVSGNSRSRPLRRIKASDFRSRIMGMDLFIPFPFPNFGNGFFIPFPFLNFGNGFFPFPSRFQISGMELSIPLPVPQLPKVKPVHPCFGEKIVWFRRLPIFPLCVSMVAKCRWRSVFSLATGKVSDGRSHTQSTSRSQSTKGNYSLQLRTTLLKKEICPKRGENIDRYCYI